MIMFLRGENFEKSRSNIFEAKKKKKRIGNLPDYEILLNVYRISISSIKKNHDLKCLILCIKENENYLGKKKDIIWIL